MTFVFYSRIILVSVTMILATGYISKSFRELSEILIYTCLSRKWSAFVLGIKYTCSLLISSSTIISLLLYSAITGGKFNATASTPNTQGIVSFTAVYNGSGLYHSAASDPAMVIVTNSTLPP